MWRYLVPVFLGAFLLFQVQPLIARYVLPWFGGTPSVWTTCMLFFQVLLLLGYGYSHLIVSRLRPRAQVLAHLALLSGSLGLLLLLTAAWKVPLIPGESLRPTGSQQPVLHILLLLGATVGLPYFALSATSPLLQAFFARTHRGISPYRLYSLSNVGSLLALLSYPFLFEPLLPLATQAWAWSAAYVVFCVACAYAAARTWHAPPLPAPAGAGDEARPTAAGDDARPTAALWLQWTGLAALASVLLLAMTNQTCQEVAVVPFLWILPLSLYLLTFIICFDNSRWYARHWYVSAAVLVVPAILVLLANEDEVSVAWQVVAYAAALFVLCMVCHGELVALKPGTRHLTVFYLAVSAGGALGGVLVGVVSPVLFRGYYEIYVGLMACWLVCAWVVFRHAEVWARGVQVLSLLPMVVGIAAVIIAYQGDRRAHSDRPTVHQARNFYGVLRVTETVSEDLTQNRFTLVHGRTIHGFQYTAEHLRHTPVSYYGPRTGIGLAVHRHPRRLYGDGQAAELRIGVVGLGTGTAAAFGRSGDVVRFYEINPQIRRLSDPDGYFTYLTDTPATVEVVMGDARVSMSRELEQGGSQRYDVLALDAFSSDAIPAHLLTLEAMELYLGHLRDEQSILAVHISNKVLDLVPVVRSLAEHLGLQVARVQDDPDEDHYLTSDWVLLCRSREPLADPEIADAGSEMDSPRRVRLWTDDYHSLFSILE